MPHEKRNNKGGKFKGVKKSLPLRVLRFGHNFFSANAFNKRSRKDACKVHWVLNVQIQQQQQQPKYLKVH